MDLETIDLVGLLKILKHRIWLIILVSMLSITLTIVYTIFIVDKKYSADVLLYIWQDSKSVGSSSSSSNYSDMMLFAQLVNDYQVLCKSRLVASTVAEKLGMDALQAKGLSGQITVGTKSNTRHLTITVSDLDPARAAQIANTVSTVFAQVVVDNMGTGTVKIIDPAIVPSGPSSPNVKINLAIGLLIGLMLGIGIAVLIEILDTRVKLVADVEAITGFTPLGCIPEFEFARDQQGGNR